MAQAHFSLTWEKYRHSMCDGFSALQQNGEFVDMTISADGYLVKVHQMIISLASPYLKELIQSAPCPHPVIFLNNVSHQMLCCILEYIYTGEVALPADKLTRFIETAKALHIKGLEDMLHYQHSTVAQEPPVFHMEPVAVQTVSKPGTGVLQIQVVGEGKPSEVVLPSSARNIKIKRDTLINSPNEKSSTNVQESMETEYHEEAAADSDDNSTLQNLPSDKQINQDPKKGDLQYTVSNRGALQLILNRYMYNMTSRSRNGTMRRWKCVDYRNHKCPATATTDDSVVVSRVAMHTHPFHDKRIMSKIEKNAVFTAITKAEEASKNTEAYTED